MKLTIIALLLLLAASAVTVSQEQLPEYGDVSDLKAMQKVYLSADSTDARKMILKELRKYPSLSVANSPDEAEFILEFKVLRHEDASPGILGNLATTYAEMTAYIRKEQRRRIAWSKTQDDAGVSRPNEVNLTRNFLKELKKARGTK
jgi:hypothetical protein